MAYSGLQIKGYTLLHSIGKGGMGEVYFARHKEQNKEAAIKLLYQTSAVDRFKNEAKIHAQVKHKNIAELYEYGVIDGRHYIIMEYVNGASLDDFIERNPLLNNKIILDVFSQVVSAVYYLHNKGIQHRDIKLANIKLTKENKVKLIDFGISKNNKTPKFTKTGYIIGTMDNLAPEQLKGKGSLKSDNWSLGVLLYLMATKYQPFYAKDWIEQKIKIEASKYTKPILLNPDLSDKIVLLIENLLRVKPENRLSLSKVLKIINEKENEVNTRIDFHMELKPYKNIILISIFSLFGIFAVSHIFSNKSVTKPEIEPVTESKIRLDEEEIEIIIQNSNTISLIVDGEVKSNSPPYFIERVKNTDFKFTLKDQGYTKDITMKADFKGKKFICNMDY